MDNLQPFGAEEAVGNDQEEDDASIEAPPQIGTDERRMHVRAYNYWASLLDDAPYPSIGALDPKSVEDFEPNSVLIDFTAGVQNPTIAYLGQALREECDFGSHITRISEVPSRSLLSRLTDHYMQIIANQAPVGFEAKFVNNRDRNTLYRGILMPFSSKRDTIDFIYGVINWKEAADAAIEKEIRDQVGGAFAVPSSRHAVATPVWADGPHQEAPDDSAIPPEADAEDGGIERGERPEPETLADHLVLARSSADQARRADRRSRKALYDALGEAYDFALAAADDPDSYQELLDESGIAVQERAPMTPIAKLVFGADYDKTRLTEFAAALGHAKREDLPAGSFADYIDTYDGGLKAIVAAERAARRPADKADPLEAAKTALRDADIQGFVTLGKEQETDGEFAVLIARKMPDGRFAVLGTVQHDDRLVGRAIRKFAR